MSSLLYSLQIFIAKRENGDTPESDPGSADPDGLVKSIGVIAMLSGKSEMLASVERCVKVTQVCGTRVEQLHSW